MIKIEIDDEVYGYLQKRARPFVDTPNTTLRRELKIGDSANKKIELSDPVLEKLLAESGNLVSRRSKAAKADLRQLIDRGALREGQRLYLIDYRGNRVKKLSAIVASGDLHFDNKRYSMSNLATELLQKEGFKSQAVRGPMHWITEDGKSVKQLWDGIGAKK